MGRIKGVKNWQTVLQDLKKVQETETEDLVVSAFWTRDQAFLMIRGYQLDNWGLAINETIPNPDELQSWHIEKPDRVADGYEFEWILLPNKENINYGDALAWVYNT